MTDTKKPDLRVVTESDIPVDVPDGPDPSDLLYIPPPDEQLWYDFADFKKIENVREYIIKGWLIAHGITAFLARRGTGKSTIALDLGCHLACDMDWWGMPSMDDWCVIYICGEDDEGMILNCRAWEKAHNRTVPRDRFLVAKGVISMTGGPTLTKRVEEMIEWARGRRCLVILDTWQRAIAGVSTISQEDMDIAIQNAERVAQDLNGPMIACYHPPKDARTLTIRGSAVQEDTTSGIWTLEKKDDGVLVTVTRAKGAGEGNWRKFRFDKIELPGFDIYGDPFEGIVPHKIGGNEDNTSKWLEHQKRAAVVIGNEQTAYAYQVWRHWSADPDKEWTVEAMGEKLAGTSITGENGERIDIPKLTSTRVKLAELFSHPVSLPKEGITVALVDTGTKGPGGRAVKHFRVAKIETDTGESGTIPGTLE